MFYTALMDERDSISHLQSSSLSQLGIIAETSPEKIKEAA